MEIDVDKLEDYKNLKEQTRQKPKFIKKVEVTGLRAQKLELQNIN